MDMEDEDDLSLRPYHIDEEEDERSAQDIVYQQ
ncbi:MAG: hypothetical protein CM15mV144_430 [Caudoviricetes sp.]|nr:MAG: hypothetical protein CM15mV144_430 [Caudoviricetes sp.]